MSSNKKLLQAWKNLDLALKKTAGESYEEGNDDDFFIGRKNTRPTSASYKPSRPQSSYLIRNGPTINVDSYKTLGIWPSTTLAGSFVSAKVSPNSQFRSTKGLISQIFSPKMKYFEDDAIVHSIGVADLKKIYERKCVDTKNDFNPNQLNYFIDKFNKKCKKKVFNMEDQNIGPNAALEIAELLVNNEHFIHLNLSKNSIGDYGARCIAGALRENTTIIHLDLSNNAIGHEGAAEIFEMLVENENIVSLKLNSVEGLNRNRIDVRGMRHITHCLQQNQVLQFLDLSGSSITTEGLAYLAEGLEVNKSLASLNISDNELGPKCQPLIKPLMVCNLIELDISNNKLGDTGLQLLINIFQQTSGTYSRLQTLNIGKNNITSFGATKIFDILSKNLTVKKLIMDENNLTGRGISSIVSLLFENSTLNHLSFYDCCLNYEGADALGTGLSRNFHINTLILGKNPLKDEGVKLLIAGIKDNSTITTLDLSGCKIQDEGAKLIAELITNNHVITKIDLKDNCIYDDGGLALVNAVRLNKRVTKLNLERNSMSYKYVQDIQRTIKSHGTELTRLAAASFVQEMEYLKEFENQKYAVAQEGKIFDMKQKEVNDELGYHNELLDQYREDEAEKLELLEDEYAQLLDETRQADRIKYDLEDKAQQLKADMESEIHFIIFQTNTTFNEIEEFNRMIKKEKEATDQTRITYERQIAKLKIEVADRERMTNHLESTVNSTENQVNKLKEEKVKTPRSPTTKRAGNLDNRSPTKRTGNTGTDIDARSPGLKVKGSKGFEGYVSTLENVDGIVTGQVSSPKVPSSKIAKSTSKIKIKTVPKTNPKVGKGK